MIKLTDLLSEKIKPKQKISKKEWSKIKKFNKHIGQDGTHYVVQLDKKLGTILVPVIVEEKLTEVKQLYVVASTNGNLYSGDNGVTEKQALKIMDRYSKVGMNLFMLGVQYWNKPHKYNKKKIVVKEACQKGYKTHPTRKTKIMFGKRYRNCIKAEDIESLSEDRIYSKSDGLKKVKSVSKKGKVYKVDKQKAKFGGKNVTMYVLYTKYKNHTSGQNPFGLDMARNSKGEAMYLVPIKESSGKQIAQTILQQLGGNKFIAMTGAKNLGFTNKGIQMKIGRNAKGVTHVIIDLDRGKDLYNIEFVKIRGAKRTTVKKLKGVYADQLGNIFTKYTGLRTRL